MTHETRALRATDAGTPESVTGNEAAWRVEKVRQRAARAVDIGVITQAAADRLVNDAYEREARNGCRWCGDPAVVFTNRLGAHCADCLTDGRESQQLHEAGL